MAIPLSPSPSPSSSSSLIPPTILLPVLQRRIYFKLHAHLPTPTLRSSNNGDSSSVDIDKTTNPKKKKKPRPSFYDQALERWSRRISSPRSKFPWEEQPAAETRQETDGLASDRFLDDSRGTHLSSGADFENPEGDSVGRSKVESFGRNAPWAPLGMRKGAAPWAHGGAKSRRGLDFGGKVEFLDQNVSESCSNSGQLSAADEERPKAAVEISSESGKSSVRLIVDELKNSLDQDCTSLDDSICSDEVDNVVASNSDSDVVKLTGSVRLPWERVNGGGDRGRLRRSNTELAEKTIPEDELRRLRNVALRMKERMKVGAAGVTEAVVESIHKKWKVDEVVKLWFEGPPTLHMKRTHEILERKTGGMVIWRSGSSIVLYRGMTYKLPCVQSYVKVADTDSIHKTSPSSEISTNDAARKITITGSVRVPKLSDVGKRCSVDSSSEDFDIDSFLDQLGPRYKDWSGCNPLPVDADILPGVVPGYTPPFRLLAYKVKPALKNREMTSLRRLARTMSPHFVLGRNRQHEGLARAMVTLWEKSAIAKIAIKRGVPNTHNERMAEEIKKLTGGVLLSRNKEYIVFYRGNDFVTPSVRKVLVETQRLATANQDEEEAARLRASALIVSNAKASKGPLLAGTLAETLKANTQWGHQPSTKQREEMKRDLALAKHASHVRYLERKLSFAKAKVRKAERALAKVQEFLDPAELPTDLETVTDEERFLFRQMGLKMTAYLPLGRRGVFDGTIQNMHLNWKHKELVKILVKGKSFAQVKQIAISLEAESGGVLISLDKTTKGFAVVVYRGKNYERPYIMRPKNLLTRRQALARAIELQRREALNHHISNLQESIQILKSQLDRMEAEKDLGNEHLDVERDEIQSDEDMEEEGEEAYLETYSSGDEDINDVSIDALRVQNNI